MSREEIGQVRLEHDDECDDVMIEGKGVCNGGYGTLLKRPTNTRQGTYPSRK